MVDKSKNMGGIVQDGHPALRAQAKEVTLSEISSPKIQGLISLMKEQIVSQDDAVAIAAPQVGVPLRIFVVSGATLKLADPKYKGDEDDMIFINPVVTKLSREKQEVEEGCLSVRWKYGKIKRAKKATIKAYNEHGEPLERGASGILAQVFQHETDHLNGILFIDNAYDIKDIPPETHKEKHVTG